jgi:hypothetical protein
VAILVVSRKALVQEGAANSVGPRRVSDESSQQGLFQRQDVHFGHLRGMVVQIALRTNGCVTIGQHVGLLKRQVGNRHPCQQDLSDLKVQYIQYDQPTVCIPSDHKSFNIRSNMKIELYSVYAILYSIFIFVLSSPI